MELIKRQVFLSLYNIGKKRPMAIEHNAGNERISLEEYFTLLEKDSEHGYEYLDGRIYMMTGGSPDHSIIVEVLSPTTEARDRGQKSLQYRACPSIQEYLLISSEFLLVEVFRREKHGFWTLYTLGSDDTIELTSLGIRFALAEVYQNTSITEVT